MPFYFGIVKLVRNATHDYSYIFKIPNSILIKCMETEINNIVINDNDVSFSFSASIIGRYMIRV